MTLEFIDNYLNKKLKQNDELIVYTFYELRVEQNLSETEVNRMLELTKIKLENNGYKIYRTGEKYIYADIESTVKENELMVAVKQ